MKLQRILVACLCAFVLLLLTLLIAFNHSKPRLLVVHSFSEDGRWEGLFDSGVRRALAANREPLAMRWHYMSFTGTDVQTDAEWAAASARARLVIDSWKPDVLLLVGEEAQQWVGHHYVSQDPDGPRVVYATGEDPQRFGYADAANTTGVRELLPLNQIHEVLSELGMRKPRIQALGIADPTGEVEHAQVQAYDWQPGTLLPTRLVSDYAAWQQAVKDAAPHADVLLVLSFTGLPRSASDPQPVDALEVARWTEHHATPLVLGVRESYVQGGGALALAPSADALGEQAGHLALHALPRNPLPPPETSQDYAVALRPERLAERGYKLHEIYTQAARAAHLLFREPAPRPQRP